MFNDHFGKTDKKREKQEVQEVKDSLKALGNTARVCLNSSQFHDYRKQYEATEAKVVESILRLTSNLENGELDLTAYGTKVLVFMTRLKDLRSLLTIVKNDSKKGQDDGTAEA